MNFDVLHENLRLEILRRIDRGVLSGTTLARATGFRQAHISNFLNRRRLLSLEGLNRVLASQDLTVLDLLPADIVRAPPARPGMGQRRQLTSFTASLSQTVSVVTHAAAAGSARIQPSEAIESIEVPDSILHLARERPAPGRELWQRFVAIRVDGLQAASMAPLLRQNSIVVLDRHYNSLAVYRSEEPTLYAVRAPDGLHLSFLEFEANTLVLRPANSRIPVRLIELSEKDQPGDFILGRICYGVSEF